ncbi:hypothetical protein OAA91_00660 [Fibrobacterales bacterium]|nr:hypothetical protein [Fibrobacterales bacterium]
MKIKYTLSSLLTLSAAIASFAQDTPTEPTAPTTQSTSAEPFTTTPITLVIDASKISNWGSNQTQDWCLTLEARANYKCTSPSQISKIQDSLNRIPLGNLESPQNAEDLVGAPIWKVRFHSVKTDFSRYFWFPLISEREFELNAWVSRPNKAPVQIKKSSIEIEGYCGPFSCEPEPLDANEKQELLLKVSSMILDSIITIDSLERNPAPDSTAIATAPDE